MINPSVTPVEIEKKEFSTSFRGYNPSEVRAYLELVSAEMESLTKEIRSVRDDLEEAIRERDRLREQEKRITETLVVAQSAADEARQAARNDAGLIIREAELERSKIVSEIERLKVERSAFVAQLKSFTNAFYERLDADTPAGESGRKQASG